jgi:hypothetical protein
MWTYNGYYRGRLITNNIMNLMSSVLRPLALFLVTQPLKDGKNAAPAFNLYKFNDNSTPCDQLKALIRDARMAYPDLGGVVRVVERLIDINALDKL